MTEDQHSPGQTAIPSGNAPFHISSFSAGKWIMCLYGCVCVCVCVSVCKTLVWTRLMKKYEVSCFYGFHGVNCTVACVFHYRKAESGDVLSCVCARVGVHACVCVYAGSACMHASVPIAVLVFLYALAVFFFFFFLHSLFPSPLYDVK